MTDHTHTSLKRLKDTFKPTKGQIIPPVQRMLLKSAGDVGNRDTAHVHPSEMAKDDWCPRRAWLRITEAEPNKKKANASSKMEMVFQEGHDIHDKWQTWIAKSDGLDLFGMWKCPHCDAVTASWQSELDDADVGWCYGPDTSHEWEYREVPFYSGDYRIMGHADGMVNLPDDKTVLIEIKSIGIGTLRFEMPDLYYDYINGMSVADVWMRIKRPFPSHMRQGQIYLWLAREQYNENINEIVFIYDYKPTQEVREFAVQYNPKFVESLFNDAEMIKMAVEEGEEIPRPEWAAGIEGEICSACEFSNACYGTPEEEQQPRMEPKRRVARSSSAKRRSAVRPS